MSDTISIRKKPPPGTEPAVDHPFRWDVLDFGHRLAARPRMAGMTAALLLSLAGMPAGPRAKETNPMTIHDPTPIPGEIGSGGRAMKEERFEEWNAVSPRAETAPRCSIDPKGGRAGDTALRIDAGSNPAAIGGWERRVEGIVPGKTYRFTAWNRIRNVPHPVRSVIAILDWLDGENRRVRPPDFARDAGTDASWRKSESVATAPEGAVAVAIRLTLGWSPHGVVWWDDIRLEREDTPPNRIVRVATIHLRPEKTGSPAASVEEFLRRIESARLDRPDLICLPEGITVVGTGRSYAGVSEPIPGPTTRRLGVTARKLRSYLVAGIYERADEIIYNTAVLIDRNGAVAGTYRKTHLPREEVEGGLTPGDSYPVFETDFGCVGILICWDVQFPEPARAMALRGAEILALPIWGGSDILARARAIENHLFLVSSSYDMRSFVIDPTGEIVAEATTKLPVAIAALALDRPILQPWLGDMKPRTWKERRPDLPVEKQEKPQEKTHRMTGGLFR